SDEQAIIVILNPPYAYFSTMGQMILDGSNNLLRIAIPYTAAQLPGIRYAQSGDVITMTHKDHRPKLLKRLGAASWSLTNAVFTTEIDEPTIAGTVQNTNTENNHKIDHHYVVSSWKGTDK